MKRCYLIALLMFVLLLAGITDLQAGCCFLWTDYGASGCRENLTELQCDSIANADDWKHNYYIDVECGCYDIKPWGIYSHAGEDFRFGFIVWVNLGEIGTCYTAGFGSWCYEKHALFRATNLVTDLGTTLY